MKHFTQFDPQDFDTYQVSEKEAKKGAPYDLESDDIFTFDIEVSSAWKKDGVLIGYEPGHDDDYWNSMDSYSLCYIWQFSWNGETYYGRDLTEFTKVLKKLPKNVHFICWVHNLAYELQFLMNILQPWENLFCRSKRKPMYCASSLFPNIEFRCSFMLTRKSLETWGNELNFPKLHTLEYTTIRTPLTPLKEEEFSYCGRDCEVVDRGIREQYLPRYGHVKDIPLTQTGEVRRVVKKLLRKNKTYMARVKKLIPRNADQYRLFKKVFAGGYTHANYIWAGDVFHSEDFEDGFGYAFDFASSYPAVMVCEKFPMTAFVEDYFDPTAFDHYAYIIKLELEGVEEKTFNHYISESKCEELVGAEIDNGRVMRADKIVIWCTEQDYDVIVNTYNIKNITVLQCYSSVKSYLPKDFILYILELYNNKTKLKHADKELYAISKQFINALFGMCVMDPFQDEVLFDDNGWYTEILTDEVINKEISKLKKDLSGKYFLAYQFGIWITAYARHNIWACITGNFGKEESADRAVIYCDTDSLKLTKLIDFSWYNDEINAKMKAVCDCYSIDYELTRPLDDEGEAHPLGIFAREEDFSEFCTFGAKRYCYRQRKKKDKNDRFGGDGLLHLTVAGINKDAVLILDNDIENFTDTVVFEKDFQLKNGDLIKNENLKEYYDKKKGDGDERGVHKQAIFYLDDQQPVVWKKGEEDEFHSNFKYGIAMRPTGYSMNIADEFMELISSYMESVYCEELEY